MRVVGVLASLIGLLWIGQGLGYVGGSFMTGQPDWVRNGAIALLVGLAALYASSGRADRGRDRS
jgi:hypothetical protein